MLIGFLIPLHGNRQVGEAFAKLCLALVNLFFALGLFETKSPFQDEEGLFVIDSRDRQVGGNKSKLGPSVRVGGHIGKIKSKQIFRLDRIVILLSVVGLNE